jgi:hypothetical protein
MSDKIIKDSEGNVIGRIEDEEQSSGGGAGPLGLGFLFITTPILAVIAGLVVWLVLGLVLGVIILMFGHPSHPENVFGTTFTWSAFAGGLTGLVTFVACWYFTFKDWQARELIVTELKLGLIIVCAIFILIIIAKILGCLV